MNRKSSSIESVYDSDAVIRRLCAVLDVKSMSALSLALGKSKNRIAGLRREGSLPWDDMARVAHERGVSLDWLLWGDAERPGKQYGAAPAGLGPMFAVGEEMPAFGWRAEFFDRSPVSADDQTQAAPADPALDPQAVLVRYLVQQVESALADQADGMPARRKASVIATLFRIYAAKGSAPSEADVRAIVDLTSE